MLCDKEMTPPINSIFGKQEISQTFLFFSVRHRLLNTIGYEMIQLERDVQ